MTLDDRLCDGMSVPELIENFNRVLKLVDELDERVAALEEDDAGGGSGGSDPPEGDPDGGETE